MDYAIYCAFAWLSYVFHHRLETAMNVEVGCSRAAAVGSLPSPGAPTLERLLLHPDMRHAEPLSVETTALLRG
jgi:hypothetical protein